VDVCHTIAGSISEFGKDGDLCRIVPVGSGTGRFVIRVLVHGEIVNQTNRCWPRYLPRDEEAADLGRMPLHRPTGV
jgi:hypothetical protein